MLKWFPSLFGYDIYTSDPGFNLPYIQGVISHGILPVATVVLASLGGFILSIRNQVITTMDEDFVLVAQAKGLPAKPVSGTPCATRSSRASATSPSPSAPSSAGR